MRTALRRSAGLASAALALTLGLAACGGSDAPVNQPGTTAGEGTSSAAAAETTPAEPTSETTSGAPSAGGDAVQEFLDHYRKGFDHLTTAAMSVTVTMDGAVVSSSTAQVDMTKDPIWMSSVTEMSGTKVETRMVDGATYMNLGAATQGKFFQVPAGSAALAQTNVDPSAQLRTIEGALISATKVGQEDVDGVGTTHYTLITDAAKVLAGTQGGAAGLPPELTYDIWLDQDGMPVKSVVQMEIQGRAVTTETRMSAFGEPVTVEVPTDLVDPPAGF